MSETWEFRYQGAGVHGLGEITMPPHAWVTTILAELAERYPGFVISHLGRLFDDGE